MSKFLDSIRALTGKKVRFFVGGGEKGFVQGPVVRVDDTLIYIEKEGEIRGTVHTISLDATSVRYYEIDKVVRDE
jgi:hypothetical protein